MRPFPFPVDTHPGEVDNPPVNPSVPFPGTFATVHNLRGEAAMKNSQRSLPLGCACSWLPQRMRTRIRSPW
jgi:hypothetical protein